MLMKNKYYFSDENADKYKII